MIELVSLQLTDVATAEALLALQQRAYQVEADLIGSDDFPPLHETLDQLQTCGETFLAAVVDGEIAGAISWRLLDRTIDIHRLVVDPRHFRQGLGVTLVRAALTAEPSAQQAIVQTGANNAPAKALYRSEGFEQLDEIQVAADLRVARFAKRLDPFPGRAQEPPSP